MKATVDTNVLVRAVTQDDVLQGKAATNLLREAETIAVSSACLCELVWVLRSVYHFSKNDIVAAVTRLVAAPNVAIDEPGVTIGLAVLAAGGDFADGLIAHEGRKLGGSPFYSFDKRAVRLVAAQGQQAILLA